MKGPFKFSVWLIVLTFSLNSCSSEGETIEEEMAIDHKIDDALFSQFVNYDYPMKIFIPKEYEDNKDLPVVYVLDGLVPSPIDGSIFFDMVVGIMRNIGLKAILVAVGDRTGVNREIDYLATGCVGGELGFTNFTNFIHQELVPYIDGKYENDHSKRTLIGFSHGGNFAYNTFFRENPNDITFHNYISIDPSRCDIPVIEEHLDKMEFSEDKVLKIHLSMADNDIEDISKLIIQKDFPWLFVDFQNFPNEDHLSVPRPSITQGLKFIYGL